jgi:ubiquinone/menaquinone biosynthesis C-methylase UbiE
MKRLIGDVKGKRLLDAGCGFGAYSLYCARQGAMVTGVDISELMIETAKKEAAREDLDIDFRVLDVTNLEGISSETFDMAISSVAISFGMPTFFKEMSRVLKKGGILCYSEVHPILGAGHNETRDDNEVYVIDSYFKRGVRSAKNAFGKRDQSDADYEWQWEHNTLQDFSVALRDAGFLIETLLEPEPEQELKELHPVRFKRGSAYPIFFMIRAIKVK